MTRELAINGARTSASCCSSISRSSRPSDSTNALRRSRAWRRSVTLSAGRGGCDGTTMAVCRKSSDATNVRWEPCAPDQGPDRDSPLGYLIASGIFVASYRAVPVSPYLGAHTALLKGIGERFEPFGEAI